MIQDTPPEIIRYICSFSTLSDRLSLSLCSKTLRRIIDFQKDPLLEKVKSKSWNISKQDLKTILGTRFPEIDRRNIKFLLKHSNTSSREEWAVAYFSTLYFDHVDPIDDLLNLKQIIPFYRHLSYENIVSAFYAAKIIIDDAYIYPFDLENRVFEIEYKAIYYSALYFLYNNEQEKLDRVLSRRHISQKKLAFVYLLKQDFGGFDKNVLRLVRKQSSEIKIRTISSAIVSAISPEDSWLFPPPTLGEKRNILLHFAPKSRKVYYAVAQKCWFDPVVFDTLSKEPISLCWKDVILDRDPKTDTWETKDMLKCIDYLLQRNMIEQDVACDIILQSSKEFDPICCSILKQIDPSYVRSKLMDLSSSKINRGKLSTGFVSSSIVALGLGPDDDFVLYCYRKRRRALHSLFNMEYFHHKDFKNSESKRENQSSEEVDTKSQKLMM